MKMIENYTQNISFKINNKKLLLMIDGKNFFDPMVENNMRTYDNIQKNAKVKEMSTQLVVSWIIIISINTIK